MCEEINKHVQETASKTSSLQYLVVELPDDGYEKPFGLKELAVSISKCDACHSSTTYPDADSAIRHLKRSIFSWAKTNRCKYLSYFCATGSPQITKGTWSYVPRGGSH